MISQVYKPATIWHITLIVITALQVHKVMHCIVVLIYKYIVFFVLHNVHKKKE